MDRGKQAQERSPRLAALSKMHVNKISSMSEFMSEPKKQMSLYISLLSFPDNSTNQALISSKNISKSSHQHIRENYDGADGQRRGLNIENRGPNHFCGR